MKEVFIRIGITEIGGDAMHTKTMEGLIGARTNMNLVDTPMGGLAISTGHFGIGGRLFNCSPIPSARAVPRIRQ